GADWTGIARVPEHLRAERTLEAMRAGYRFISGAQFPADPGTGRRGGVDLLVRSGDGYIPVLVVQGERDAFGRPDPTHNREVVLVPGDHSLKAGVDEVARAVADWLDRVLRLIE
ncbi:hypothetical protein LH612_31315, partial [Klebsiella pneumoniae]|nr:hypothetical protein [Klebsiella pneumoniae]